jgi:signal transduction histidine kinase
MRGSASVPGEVAPTRPLGGLTRRTILASGVLALVIGAAFTVLLISVTAERDSVRLARHSEQVLATAQRLQRQVQGAGESRGDAPATAAALLRLTDVPAHHARAAEIAAAVGSGGAAAELRPRIEAFIAEEQRFVRQREQRSVRQSRMARAAAIAGLAGSVALIVALACFFVRAIVMPIRRAATMAGRVSAGDLSARLPESGAGEIGALQRAFNTMGGSLQRNGEELRQLAEEQSALRRVATLVARGVPAAELLGAVVQEVDRVLGASSTRLARFLPGDVVEIIVSSQVGGGLPVGARWPAGGDHLAGQIWRTGRPARREGTDGVGGELAERLRQDGVRSAVATPIVVDGRLWGTMTAYWTDRVAAPDMEARLEQFTELVATAIANAESRAALTASRARVVATADETRRRIERDLHDGAQQRLVYTVVTLKLARRALAEPERNASFPQLVDEALEHAERANAALRELVQGILPASLSRGGLRAGVAGLVGRAPIDVRVDVIRERFAAGLEATAYFIVAEALTNVFKHAHASRAHVRVALEPGELVVEVGDDGDGGARMNGSSGLLGLYDRTAAAGGELEIDSPTGEGTTVTARLPLAGVSVPHARG